jgi:uncharacterized protein (DUF302 family)
MPVVKPSRYSYEETLSRLIRSITDAGNTIFATIDQAAAAKAAGLTLRPTSLIVFGNPKGGTLLMSAAPLVALDLPLKIAVWEQDDAVHVAYSLVSELALEHELSALNSLITTIDTSLGRITDEVV